MAHGLKIMTHLIFFSRFSLLRNANIDCEKNESIDISIYTVFWPDEINQSDYLILFHHIIFIINAKFSYLILNSNKCKLCTNGHRNIFPLQSLSISSWTKTKWDTSGPKDLIITQHEARVILFS